MALALVIGLVVLVEVEREAERIKGEVEEIEREAERIYEKLSNPFSALGASFDRELKKSLGLFPRNDAFRLEVDGKETRRVTGVPTGKTAPQIG